MYWRRCCGLTLMDRVKNEKEGKMTAKITILDYITLYHTKTIMAWITKTNESEENSAEDLELDTSRRKQKRKANKKWISNMATERKGEDSGKTIGTIRIVSVWNARSGNKMQTLAIYIYVTLFNNSTTCLILYCLKY